MTSNISPDSAPDLAKMRRDYNELSLDESYIPADGRPFQLFRTWFNEAQEAKVNLPSAMCLTTVTKEGRPASRYVNMTSFDEEDGSLVWYSSYGSRKGEDLALNPFAALVFWWGDLERSVRIEGKVEQVSAEESDAFFETRPRKF